MLHILNIYFLLYKKKTLHLKGPAKGTYVYVHQLMHILLYYILLYPSAWEDQRGQLGYNYQAGSYTLAVTLYRVVISQ